MMMGGLGFMTAGEKSRLGEESLEDGLDEREWGDIGLANGEHVWCSIGQCKKNGKLESLDFQGKQLTKLLKKN